MDTLRNDDLHGLPLELKDESGGQGGGDQNADTDVAAAVARLQTGFDTKMAEMGRDLKAAQDRADAFELRLNRPGGQSAATMPTPQASCSVTSTCAACVRRAASTG